MEAHLTTRGQCYPLPALCSQHCKGLTRTSSEVWSPLIPQCAPRRHPPSTSPPPHELQRLQSRGRWTCPGAERGFPGAGDEGRAGRGLGKVRPWGAVVRTGPPMSQDKSLGAAHNSPGQGGHICHFQILQRRKDPDMSFKRLVTQNPSSLTNSPSERPQPQEEKANRTPPTGTCSAPRGGGSGKGMWGAQGTKECDLHTYLPKLPPGEKRQPHPGRPWASGGNGRGSQA